MGQFEVLLFLEVFEFGRLDCGGMHIEELKEGELEGGKEESVRLLNAKRVFVGVGARFLFYPTLFYNVVRNKIQSEFRWWDAVDKVHFIAFLEFNYL